MIVTPNAEHSLQFLIYLIYLIFLILLIYLIYLIRLIYASVPQRFAFLCEGLCVCVYPAIYAQETYYRSNQRWSSGEHERQFYQKPASSCAMCKFIAAQFSAHSSGGVQHLWHTARNEAIAIGGKGRLITSLYLRNSV